MASRSVLFFGFYDRGYARTKVLKHGFERNGWRIEECHVDPKYTRGVQKFLKLFWFGLKAKRQSYDLVLVGFPGHNAVWIARLLFGRRIVFDAFLSNYDANLDRGMYQKDSWRAKKDKWLDTWGCRLAGSVLVDTKALGKYFTEEFGVPQAKIIAVPISADDTIFFPQEVPEEDVFTVHFHGTFIPLQGVSHIVDAAEILRGENIRFRIVGGGQEAKRIDPDIERRGLSGVIERVQKVPVEKIPGYMAGAHVVLGIFGDVERAKRAVPNKVYEAMAMGKAVITEDSRGVRELKGPENFLKLVAPGSGKAIAESVLALKNNEVRRLELGRNARAYFEQELLPESVVKKLLGVLGV